MTETNQPQGQKPKGLLKRLVLPILGGLAFGAIGGFVGAQLAKTAPKEVMLAKLGLPADLALGLGGMVAIWFSVLWIVLCIISTVLFVLGSTNSKMAEKTGIIQMIGGGSKGRAAAIPLALFYFADGGLLALLAIASLWKIDGTLGIWFVTASCVFAIIMVQTSFRLWNLLDELVRVIWVEANAISCGIMLVLGGVFTLANVVGLVGSFTAFEAIVGYHAIYLIVYTIITFRRAPEMLTSPTLEGA